MEQFVGRLRRAHHVVVDPAVGDRVVDRVAGRGNAPVAPGDHQPAPGVRMQAPRGLEEFAPAHPVEGLAGEHQRDGLVRRGVLLQAGERLARRLQALDAVVATVPGAQRRVDVAEVIRIAVDGEDHRRGYPSPPLPPRPVDFHQILHRHRLLADALRDPPAGIPADGR